MTDVLSHDKATIFVNGICDVHISFLNVSYNFSALQFLASILIILLLIAFDYLMLLHNVSNKKIHLSLQI